MKEFSEEHKQRLKETHVGFFGKHHTEMTKQKLRDANSPNWKGDDAGYNAIHDWVRRRKPKPELCESCNERKPRDLANISGEYKRDINDFQWLCRRCHEASDGRLEENKTRMLGKHLSEDSKRKISESNSGEKNHNFGKHPSEETRRKLKESHLGLFSGEKHPFFGKHHTQESKQKIKEGTTGEKNPMFGKHHSEKTKQRLRDINLGRHHTEEEKQKMRENNVRSMLGKHHSEDTKKKMRDAKLGGHLSEATKQKMREARQRYLNRFNAEAKNV